MLLLSALLIGLLFTTWQAPAAYGAGIVINSLADTALPGDGNCTLREGVTNANQDRDSTGGDCLPGSGADTISFNLAGVIRLAGQLPPIAQSLSITGHGAQNLTISGDTDGDGFGNVPIFSVQSGVIFNLASIKLAGGLRNSTDSGGALANQGVTNVSSVAFTGNSAGRGGAIHNTGVMTVSNSIFSGNSATATGGGINNKGALTVIHGAFLGNSAPNHTGGGIANDTGGTLSVTHSTFANNTARYGGGLGGASGTITMSNSTLHGNTASSAGGGILSNGVLTATNVTISDNSAPLGGGVRRGQGTVTLYNTIVANAPSGGNCSGPVGDGGGNLRWPITDQTCVGAFGDPKLGVLADNGGPTQTMALLSGSAAVDFGIDLLCQAAPGSPTFGAGGVDQRDFARPWGARCDIGAYEYETAQPSNLPPEAQPDSYVTQEKSILSVAPPGVLANDTDPESAELSAVLASGPANGNVTFNADGSFTYRPQLDFSGADSFTYRANDGSAFSGVAKVTITVSPSDELPTAITASALTTGRSPASPATTTMVTIGANKLALIWVVQADGTGGSATLSDPSRTWAQVGAATDGYRKITLYRSMAPVSTSGAITITSPAPGSMVWSLAEYASVDTSGVNGAGAVVQMGVRSYKSAGGAMTTSGSVTLGQSSQPSSAVAAGFALHQNGLPLFPGDGYTLTGRYSCYTVCIQPEFRSDFAQLANMSWAYATHWMVVAVELKPAS